MSRSLRLILPAIVLTGALAGCGGHGSSSPGPAGSTAAQPVNTAAATAECQQFGTVHSMITSGMAGDTTNAKVLATLKAHGSAWSSLLKAAARPAVREHGEPGLIALALDTEANELAFVRSAGVLGTQSQVTSAWTLAQAELGTIAKDCASA
jgi:hypothetical protein